MGRHRTAVVVISTLAVAAFGAYYLATVADPQPGVVVTIVAAIAGLGGYEVRERTREGKP